MKLFYVLNKAIKKRKIKFGVRPKALKSISQIVDKTKHLPISAN